MIKSYDIYLRFCVFDCNLRCRFAVRSDDKLEFPRYRAELM